MLISHYAESADKIIGGISESIKNQRKAIARAGFEYTEHPDFSADILHLNVTGPRSCYYAFRAKDQSTKLVISAHTTTEDAAGSYRFSNYFSRAVKPYLTFFYSLADLLIAPSAYTKELLRTNYGIGETPIRIITNGIDRSKLDGYQSLREHSRDKYGVQGDVVFCVGSVFERKGVQAFTETARLLPDTDFIWFGKLHDQRLLSEQTRESIAQAPDNVTFTGYVDDIREAYAAGDVFFYPTFVENQGIPAYEAAYCGKPAVLRDIPPFAENFEDGYNCFKGDCPGEFAGQLRTMLNNETLRQQLINNAYTVPQRHSIEAVQEQLQAAYTALANGSISRHHCQQSSQHPQLSTF